MENLALIFLWAWMRAHPQASYSEFHGAFKRTLKLMERNLPGPTNG